jgi:hypothetical protein
MGEERTHDRIYIKRKGRGSEKKWPTREDVLESGRSPFFNCPRATPAISPLLGEKLLLRFSRSVFEITFFVVAY